MAENFQSSTGRHRYVISAIPGLNPSGGFPSETVQFGFPYRKCLAIAFPAVFSQDEMRVISVNIKLDIDNKKIYEQVKKGFPFFEEKVESTIEKYFEGKFYKDIQFVQEKLRKELHAKLNQEVKGGEIKGVELEDFLIQ